MDITLEDSEKVLEIEIAEDEYSCAYVSTIQEIVEFAINKNQKLFDQNEIKIIEKYLHLSFDSKRIFSRMFMRKTKWLYSQVLMTLLPIYDIDESEQSKKDRLSKVITELQSIDYLDTFHLKCEFEKAWEIARGVFKADDWNSLHKIMLNAKPKAANKEELIKSFYEYLLSQKTCFGQNLKDRFVGNMDKYLKSKTDKSLPVSIPSPIITIFRRITRLYHITCCLPMTATSSSIYYPITTFASLLSRFKIVKYPKYELITPQNGSYESNLFFSSKEFHQWEASNELLSIFELIDHHHLQRDTESTADDGLHQYHIQSLYQQIIFESIKIFDCETFQTLFLDSSSSLFQIIHGLFQDPTHWTPTECLRNVGLSSVLCLISLVIDSDLFSRQTNCGKLILQEKDYLIRYHPIANLAYLVYSVAEFFEKDQFGRDYYLSIALYEVLLRLPVLEHRRGKFYKRICIDYEHLKLPWFALNTIRKGLEDSNILLSDEIDLLDRKASLLKKMSRSLKVELLKDLESSKKSFLGIDHLSEETSKDFKFIHLMLELHSLENTTECSLKSEFSLLCDYLVPHIFRNYFPLSFTEVSISNSIVMHKPVKFESNIIEILDSDDEAVRVQKEVNIEIHIEDSEDDEVIIVSPPKVNSMESSHWTCQICTFINKSTLQSPSTLFKSTKRTCEMCGSPTSSSNNNTSSNFVTLNNNDSNALSKNLKSPTNLKTNSPLKTKKIEQCKLNNSLWKCFSFQNTVQLSIDELFVPWKALLLSFYDSQSISEINLKEEESEIIENEDGVKLSSILDDSNNILTHCGEILLGDKFKGITNLCHDLQSFVVSGKRFGDPKRKGKNRFCGIDDKILIVEDFVMQKCYQVDHDDDQEPMLQDLKNGSGSNVMKSFSCISYSEAVDGGGWEGWHCEGGILRALVGLSMWEIFFLPFPEVFLTPYQDGPIDFPYPSYYEIRKKEIHDRVVYLFHLNDIELANEIDRVYQLHYGESCRILSWDSYSLASLQLAAMCLHGTGLATLCLAMSMEFKQFRSGAPDLFLVRVTKPSFSNENKYEPVPLSQFLGEEWKKKDNNIVFSEDDLLTSNSSNNSNPDDSEKTNKKKKLWITSKKKKPENENENEYNEKIEMKDDLNVDESLEILESNDIENSQVKQRPGIVWPEEFDVNSWRFEAMCVEVKGPTDQLAYKQLLWLQLLSLSIHSIKSYVCHVKE